MTREEIAKQLAMAEAEVARIKAAFDAKFEEYAAATREGWRILGEGRAKISQEQNAIGLEITAAGRVVDDLKAQMQRTL